MLHAAVVDRGGETFIFLSPDGEEFLEVDAPMGLGVVRTDEEAGEAATAARNHLAGKSADGSEQRETIPLRYAPGYFSILPHDGEAQIYKWDGGWVAV